jgi:hypothetical protein
MKPVVVVKTLGRLCAFHADGFMEHEAGFEHVRLIAPAPVGYKTIAVTKKRERAV